MKVAEMVKGGTLPERVGKARLQFGYKGWTRRLPFRQRNRIVLPDTSLSRAEFFPLQKGRQFLFRHRSLVDGVKTWFGGTDESPFLVELTDGSFLTFEIEGEEKFYAALKPEVIALFEKELKVSAKRQGDVFALPIPYSWKDARHFALVFLVTDTWSGRCLKANRVKRQPLFGTRHRLTGKYMSRGEALLEQEQDQVLAEGTVEAPDHSPMELQGVHLLAQTANLADSTKAD